jgi:hypothetical protein
MKCPDCNNELNWEPRQTHYEANGDIYSYHWCDPCGARYETCRDYTDTEEGTPVRCLRR